MVPAHMISDGLLSPALSSRRGEGEDFSDSLSGVFPGRPTEHFDEAGRLAGAEDAYAKDFAGHPEGCGGHDKQQNERA